MIISLKYTKCLFFQILNSNISAESIEIKFDPTSVQEILDNQVIADLQNVEYQGVKPVMTSETI